MSIEASLRQLWKTSFGDEDAFLDAFFRTAYSPARCRYLEEDGLLAAALYWLDCSCAGRKYAYLYAVATDPVFRGRGLCRTLMAQTHALLARQGYAGTILVPGEPELFAMYEKMGYATMRGMDSFSCAAGVPGALTEATPAQFAQARRKYLPRGGVLQEGESLSFLAQYARLYIGESFTLAAVPGEEFLGLELLGDPGAAPGILACLGYESGTFRVPGEKPFAMYRPLTDAPAPTYFGLAFD